MRVEFFTLCDGAYNYNGKLTIVGTVDGVKTTAIPGVADFSIAMKLLVMPEENGQKEVVINITDPSGEELPANIIMNLNIESQQTESHVSIAVGMHGVPFKVEGKYAIKVLLGTEVLGVFPFYVKAK